MPAVEFPYTRHRGYLMPIVPISIHRHRLWVFVDSGATFSMLAVDEAARIGIDWRTGRHQMIVVGDGSYIPTFIHDLLASALKAAPDWFLTTNTRHFNKQVALRTQLESPHPKTLSAI